MATPSGAIALTGVSWSGHFTCQKRPHHVSPTRELTPGRAVGKIRPLLENAARDEGLAELAEWFETLAKAEKSHAGRFSKGLTQIAGKEPAEAI